MFTSERGAPFTTAGFARMVERAGEAAKLGFKGCATPAASSWPMTGTIRGPCKHGSDIATSSTQFATRSLRQIASRTSGVESFSTLAARKRGFEAFPHQMDGGSVPLFWVVVQKLERDSNGLFSQPAWIGRRTDQP